MTPTNELHDDFKILKVKDIFEVNLLSFVNKCLHGECPELFSNYFNRQQHTYNVRINKLRVPRSRTSLGSNSVKIKGAVLWNNLDRNVKLKADLKCFKRLLKVHYLHKYMS